MRSRQELEAIYDHPYRELVPLSWRQDHLPLLTGVTAALVAAAAGLATFGSAVPLLSWLAVLAVLLWALRATTQTIVGVGATRMLTRQWDAEAGDLEAARARRPHRAEADADLVHDEWAVAVAPSHPVLLLLRFRPLPAARQAPDGWQLLPGRPMHAVRVEGELPYDADDVAVAAAQLADAQAQAAEHEAAAIAVVRAAAEAEPGARERALEARSTAEALRRITGQDP